MALTSRSEAIAFQTLDTALSTNDGRIYLFRQLAAYEDAGDFESWCKRWHQNPENADAQRFWGNIHQTYMVAWRELGDELFRKYLRLGYIGLNLRGPQ